MNSLAANTRGHDGISSTNSCALPGLILAAYRALEAGARTPDLGGHATTSEFTDEVVDRFCVIGGAERCRAKLHELEALARRTGAAESKRKLQ